MGQPHRLELTTVRRVVHPVTLELQQLAGADIRKYTSDSDNSGLNLLPPAATVGN
jgi:hypothetical protein